MRGGSRLQCSSMPALEKFHLPLPLPTSEIICMDMRGLSGRSVCLFILPALSPDKGGIKRRFFFSQIISLWFSLSGLFPFIYHCCCLGRKRVSISSLFRWLIVSSRQRTFPHALSSLRTLRNHYFSSTASSPVQVKIDKVGNFKISVKVSLHTGINAVKRNHNLGLFLQAWYVRVRAVLTL